MGHEQAERAAAAMPGYEPGRARVRIQGENRVSGGAEPDNRMVACGDLSVGGAGMTNSNAFPTASVITPTDGTVEILREYGQRCPGRFRWLSEPDAGLGRVFRVAVRIDLWVFMMSDTLVTCTKGFPGGYVPTGLLDQWFTNMPWVKSARPTACVGAGA